jgi:hypothetical protein
MNLQEREHWEAERNFLRDRLSEMPVNARLTRRSAEARLREIEEKLAAADVEREPARALLTFRGMPVVDSRGVFAEFGLSATKAFTDVVAKVAAALSGPLAATGPVPDRDQNQLLITNTAVGSFGFVLEEAPSAGQSFLRGESPVAQALELTRALLQSTLGTDDELADSAAAADPRALASVRSFLEVLAAHEAVCALEYGSRAFRFSDVGEVRRSLARIGQDNLLEVEKELEGEFLGVLPKRRTFELRLAGSEEVIGGKVGPGVVDPGRINDHLNERTRIQVLETRVGNGKPRYVLTAEPEWTARQ